jgi:hypothetical protein
LRAGERAESPHENGEGEPNGRVSGHDFSDGCELLAGTDVTVFGETP